MRCGAVRCGRRSQSLLPNTPSASTSTPAIADAAAVAARLALAHARCHPPAVNAQQERSHRHLPEEQRGREELARGRTMIGRAEGVARD